MKKPFQNQRSYCFFKLIVTLSTQTNLLIVIFVCCWGFFDKKCVHLNKVLFSGWYLEKWLVIPGIEFKGKISRKIQNRTNLQCSKLSYSLCTLLNWLCPENNFVLISHFALCVSVVWKSYIWHLYKTYPNNVGTVKMFESSCIGICLTLYQSEQ